MKKVDFDLHKYPAAIRYKFLELLGIKQKTVKAPDEKYRLNLVEHFQDDNREGLKKRTELLREQPGSEGNVVSDAASIYQLTSGRRPYSLLKFHNSTCFIAHVLEPVETKTKGVYNLKWAIPIGTKKVDFETEISGQKCIYGGKTFSVKGHHAKGTKIEIECETFNLIHNENDNTYKVSAWAPRFIKVTDRKPMTIDEVVDQAAKDHCLQLKEIGTDRKIRYFPGKSGEEESKIKKQIGEELSEKIEKLSESPDLAGIYLTAPHGEMIWTGAKTALVKSKKFEEHIDKPLYLISRGLCYGIVKLSEPEAIDKDEFSEKYSFHLVEDYERREWWNETFPLYYYEVEFLEKFLQPKKIELPQGIQVFLKEVEFKSEVPDEFSKHSREKCMDCSDPPEYEVLWAEGMGHAWFCSKHLKEFYKKKKGESEREGCGIDLDTIKKIDNGVASEKFKDNRNPAIHPNNFAQFINQLAEKGSFEGWLGQGMGGGRGMGGGQGMGSGRGTGGCGGGGRLNSPTFAYKTLYGKLPDQFLPGRSGAPQKIWKGITVDADLKESWLEQLNSTPGIEIRSTEQGKSEERPAFVVFRLKDPKNDDKAKAVALALNKVNGFVSQSDIGGEGRPRIVVVSKIWKDLDPTAWENFWEKLPGQIKEALNSQGIN